MLRACAALLVSCAGVAAVIAACSGTSTTTTVTTVTGVLVRSESLFAGHGCGRGDSQVYKYAVVVSYDHDASPDLNLSAGVFDCFTDAVFPNLAPSTTGSLSFNVAVYAFNEKAYDPNAKTIGDAIARANGVTQQDGSVQFPDPAPVLKPIATWTSTCAVAQQANIQVLAVCQPLATPSVTVSDAGVDAAPDAPADSAPDAPADGALDAPADGASDAPADGAPDAPADAASEAATDGSSDAPQDADAGAG